MNFANRLNRAARNTPDRVAVADPRRSLTYDELRSETDRFAASLEDQGIDQGETVGLLLPNSATFVATYYGTMKRGAVPLPINLRFDPETVSYVLKDADVEAVVTAAPFVELIQAAGGDSVDTVIVAGEGSGGTQDYREFVAAGAAEFDVCPRKEDELAHIVYTSGTTGRPKGVRHTHGNLRTNADGFVRYMKWDEHDIALTVCPCFHVAGLNAGVNPFVTIGAENHLLPEWDVETALTKIADREVTYVGLIPTMILDLLAHDGLDDYRLDSVEIVVTGGAPMPRDRIDSVEELFDCTLIETWGMTESSPLAVINRPDRERKPSSIGLVAEEVAEVRIEDVDSEEPVETGETGEMLITGDTVMDGYHNLPEANREAFVDRGGRRWLRSGDVGYRDEDGFLFIEDRIDHMIITGGENVYPSRIEDVLYELAAVDQAAVVGTPHERLGEVITAVIVDGSGELTADDVERKCREASLADYMIPRRVEFVDEIPKTATQKIDKAALEESLS